MGIGARIAAERGRRGWSQGRLAEELSRVSGHASLTRNEVSRWERDQRRPRWWLRHLADVLDLGPAEAEREACGDDPAVADALRVAHEWLVTDPPQAKQLAAGRRIGSEVVVDAEARVQRLRLLDDHLGGADTIDLVTRELRAIETLVREGSYTDDTGQRLLSVVGELHQLAGWVASDAGRHRHAERLYLDGVRAAHTADDPLTAANLLSSLAYQVANVGRPSDAVLLARTAVKGADLAAGRVRALLFERVAWAHARAGEATEAERALDEVDEAHANARGGEPSWVYWLDRTEVDVMAGRVYVEVARPLRAVPLLSHAIAAYPGDHTREVGLYETWLAEAYLQANEPDAARAVLYRASQHAAGTNSERLNARLRHLYQ